MTQMNGNKIGVCPLRLETLHHVWHLHLDLCAEPLRVSGCQQMPMMEEVLQCLQHPPTRMRTSFCVQTSWHKTQQFLKIQTADPINTRLETIKNKKVPFGFLSYILYLKGQFSFKRAREITDKKFLRWQTKKLLKCRIPMRRLHIYLPNS